jgi:hypothetical protein
MRFAKGIVLKVRMLTNIAFVVLKYHHLFLLYIYITTESLYIIDRHQIKNCNFLLSSHRLPSAGPQLDVSYIFSEPDTFGGGIISRILWTPVSG